MAKKSGQDLTAHCILVQSTFPTLSLVTFLLTRNYAWVTDVVTGANDAHPWVECSNRGVCDRLTGYFILLF
jgi:hypothetical protein